MLLYPDMSRASYMASDHFMFAAPCSEQDWKILLANRNEPNRDRDHLPFTFIKENYGNDDLSDTTCIILMKPGTPDDDAIDTGAWIRVTEEYTNMIYALTYNPEIPGHDSISFAAIVARTAGVDPKQVRYIDLPTQQEEDQ